MTKNSPRILHIFSSLELGGTQRRFVDYIKGSEAGFTHLVYAMDGRYDALKLLPGVEPLFNTQTVVI